LIEETMSKQSKKQTAIDRRNNYKKMECSGATYNKNKITDCTLFLCPQNSKGSKK
jgi:hypothetical protein